MGERVRVRVTAGFWAALGVFWVLDRWGVVPPFLLAAALHEAGHLIALLTLEIPVRELELRASGAVIRADLRGAPREAWAIAAGPAFNLLLAAVFFRLLPLFAHCNAALGLFNLLPLTPLDGGRLCAMILRRSGKRGEAVRKLLHGGTLLFMVGLDVCWLASRRAGLLTALLPSFFLLRLLMGLAKSETDW